MPFQVSLPRKTPCHLCTIAYLTLFALAWTACSSDSSALHVKAAWTVRCAESGGCGTFPTHTVDTNISADGIDASCTITNLSSTQKSVFFSIAEGSDAEIELRNGLYTNGTGTLEGASCTVRVTENNRYEGSCGPNAPSTAQPCTFSNIQIEGNTLTGALRCAKLPLTANNTSRVELIAPSEGAEQNPLDFEFSGCRTF